MEKLAHYIAENVAKSNGLSEERKLVIAYGLGALIQMLFLMLVSIVFGLLYHCLIEAMIVFWAVGILKGSAGGAHARTSASCTIISLISIFLMALVSRYAAPVMPNYRFAYLAFVALTYSITALAIYRLAPVASPNKPISREEKRARLRKRSFVTVLVYCAISTALILLSGKYPRCINASISLCLAALWQSFMLTGAAGRFISSLDSSASAR